MSENQLADLASEFDDDTAIDVVKGIAVSLQRRDPALAVAELDSLRSALRAVAPMESDTGPVSDGELARDVLRAAAADQNIGAAIRTATQARESFGAATTILLAAAAVTLLRVSGYIRFKDGKWEVDFQLRPLGAATMKSIVTGLLRLLI